MEVKTARIFDIKRMAVHDGPGIRTTVFFKSCPLNCLWCHNPEGLSAKKQLSFMSEKCVGCGKCIDVCPYGVHKISNGAPSHNIGDCMSCGACEAVCRGRALKLYGYDITVDELFEKLLRDRDFYERSGGGVTLSGGECLLQADFCGELLKMLKESGIHTAVDTCGFVSRGTLDKVIPYTDIFLYDVKAVNEDVHIACTGKSNTLILDNLRYLDSIGKAIEIRVPVVPGYNDGELAAIHKLIESINRDIKIKELKYHGISASKWSSLGLVYKCKV